MTPAPPLQPVFFVTGASGSGKSTVTPHLIEELRGECVVIDGDWLIDPMVPRDGSPMDWDAVRDVLLHIAAAIALNHLPTVILGSLLPEQIANLKGSHWIGDPHFVVLDCSDADRADRIMGRPPWRASDVDTQIGFADWLRTNMDRVITTSNRSPEDTALELAAWILSHPAAAQR